MYLPNDPQDVYSFTIAEIRTGLPDNTRELVEFRRTRRAEYLNYDIPLTWENDPKPIVVGLAAPERARPGDVFHGAIVAREFGLPCVMGTGHLVRILRSGDRVRVDGTTGVVQALAH